VLTFAQHEGKRRGGSTWWVLVAGEETNKSLRTWLRAAAAVHQSSESERGARERQNTRGRNAADGRGDPEPKETI
jgi:hypothetical protein